MNIRKTLPFVLCLCIAGCGIEGWNTTYSTLTINGTQTKLATHSGFYTVMGKAYSIMYHLNPESPDLKSTISFGLPTDVTTGQTYTQDTTPWYSKMSYYDASGVMYGGPAAGSTFTITVTNWPGKGGNATGTYSATLKTEDGTAQVVITDGQFTGWIYN
jgi:hypothetical protein